MDLKLKRLEEAAHILLAPPNIVDLEQRRSAENIFLDFRKSRAPYEICKYILETSKNEYVLFESAGLLKDALIREWSSLEPSEIGEIRQFLMNYLYSQPVLPTYVRDRIIQCIAIMIKRDNIIAANLDRKVIFDEICDLLNKNENMQAIACSMLKAILLEYSTTIKSSDVGLPWELHFKAKVKFETTSLIAVFTQIVGKLYVLIEDPTSLNGNKLKFFEKLISLSEMILSWPFRSASLPVKLHVIFDGDHNPSLRPSMVWKDVFLNPKLLELYFKVYWRIRNSPQLCHSAGNCLVQLASLSGPIMTCMESRQNYLSSYLNSLVQLLSNIEVSSHEVVLLSSIMRQLSAQHSSMLCLDIDSKIVQDWLHHLTQLTCACSLKCLPTPGVSEDEAMLYDDAMDQLLDTWVTLIVDTDPGQRASLGKSYTQMLDIYLKTHLSPPVGIRQNLEKIEEIEDCEENDRTKYSDQLATIGVFGRIIPEHSLTLLTTLLGHHIQVYQSLLEGASQNRIPSSDAIQILNEDLHWLVMIAGSVLTLDNKGETALIPSELMQYSMQQTRNINQDATIKLLTSINQAEFQWDVRDCDSLVRLIACVLRLCQLETCALELKLSHLLSPEVACTLLWFARRFLYTYICPNEAYYVEMSLPLLNCFGSDSAGLEWCLNFLLSKVLVNLQFWNAEPEVLDSTICLLLSFSALMNDKRRGKYMVGHDLFHKIIQLFWNNSLTNLSPPSLSSLFKSFVLGIASHPTESVWSPHLYSLVIQPLQTRYKELCCSPGDKIQEISQLLDCLSGVMQGVTPSNFSFLFNQMSPIIQDCARLLSQYHNYNLVVDNILLLFTQASTNMLCYLNMAQSTQLYHMTLSVIKSYAQHNVHKRSVEKCAEDDTRNGLQLVVTLLTSLLSKDCLDLSQLGENSQSENEISGASICLYGLGLIMPIMSIDLLRVPSFCSDYFKLITLVCELHPEKVCSLEPDLLGSLLTGLQLGLAEFGTDITSLVLDCLQVLAGHIFAAKLQITPAYSALAPFLKLIMDLLLGHTLNSALINQASAALFSFICCYQEEYKMLVNSLISGQCDATQSQRLAMAFTSLTKGTTFMLDRSNRMIFKQNFEEFFIEIRGILLIM